MRRGGRLLVPVQRRRGDCLGTLIRSPLSGSRGNSRTVGAPSGLFPFGNSPGRKVETLVTRVVAGQQTRTRYCCFLAGAEPRVRESIWRSYRSYRVCQSFLVSTGQDRFLDGVRGCQPDSANCTVHLISPSVGTGSLTHRYRRTGRDMTGAETRYEVTEIKAIRGTESKTITNKQQEGWELVTQQQGRLRTTMTFRRPKPKPPWRLWAALGAAGVILAGILTVGTLLEDDSDASTTNAVAASSAEQPSPQPAPEREAEPSSSADPMMCDTSPRGNRCKFGQTAIYSDKVRSGEVKLEITVGAPVEFTLSEDARIPNNLPPQPLSVYFPITVKNTSPDSTMPTMVHTQATNAEQGARAGIWEVRDGDVGLRSITSALSLPVGESLSVKEGWNMATLEGVEYRVKIDGLAGYSITFTR